MGLGGWCHDLRVSDSHFWRQIGDRLWTAVKLMRIECICHTGERKPKGRCNTVSDGLEVRPLQQCVGGIWWGRDSARWKKGNDSNQGGGWWEPIYESWLLKLDRKTMSPYLHWKNNNLHVSGLQDEILDGLTQRYHWVTGFVCSQWVGRWWCRWLGLNQELFF